MQSSTIEHYSNSEPALWPKYLVYWIDLVSKTLLWIASLLWMALLAVACYCSAELAWSGYAGCHPIVAFIASYFPILVQGFAWCLALPGLGLALSTLAHIILDGYQFFIRDAGFFKVKIRNLQYLYLNSIYQVHDKPEGMLFSLPHIRFWLALIPTVATPLRFAVAQKVEFFFKPLLLKFPGLAYSFLRLGVPALLGGAFTRWIAQLTYKIGLYLQDRIPMSFLMQLSPAQLSQVEDRLGLERVDIMWLFRVLRIFFSARSSDPNVHNQLLLLTIHASAPPQPPPVALKLLYNALNFVVGVGIALQGTLGVLGLLGTYTLLYPHLLCAIAVTSCMVLTLQHFIPLEYRVILLAALALTLIGISIGFIAYFTPMLWIPAGIGAYWAYQYAPSSLTLKWANPKQIDAAIRSIYPIGRTDSSTYYLSFFGFLAVFSGIANALSFLPLRWEWMPMIYGVSLMLGVRLFKLTQKWFTYFPWTYPNLQTQKFMMCLLVLCTALILLCLPSSMFFTLIAGGLLLGNYFMWNDWYKKYFSPVQLKRKKYQEYVNTFNVETDGLSSEAISRPALLANLLTHAGHQYRKNKMKLKQNHLFLRMIYNPDWLQSVKLYLGLKAADPTSPSKTQKINQYRSKMLLHREAQMTIETLLRDHIVQQHEAQKAGPSSHQPDSKAQHSDAQDLSMRLETLQQYIQFVQQHLEIAAQRAEQDLHRAQTQPHSSAPGHGLKSQDSCYYSERFQYKYRKKERFSLQFTRPL